MASAAEMFRRLQSVSDINVLQNMVYEDIKANENILKDLKEEEYEMGDIYSNKTNARYKPNVMGGFSLYAKHKHNLNPIAGEGNVDLINTGSFIRSFSLNKPKGNKYLFNATDSKKNKLIKKYGDIMGLDQQTFEDFQVVIIKPLFVEKLRKIINKK
jgi:hypothetical protein